jgi:hypothetical protein
MKSKMKKSTRIFILVLTALPLSSWAQSPGELRQCKVYTDGSDYRIAVGHGVGMGFLVAMGGLLLTGKKHALTAGAIVGAGFTARNVGEVIAEHRYEKKKIKQWPECQVRTTSVTNRSSLALSSQAIGIVPRDSQLATATVGIGK